MGGWGRGIHICHAPHAAAMLSTQPTGTNMVAEKRKHARFDALNLSYVCEDKDGDILYEGMGRTLNVSEGGMLLETNFFISPGNTLTLSVAIEDELVNLRGRVIYCHEGEGKMFRTGLEFLNIDEESRAVLNSFIKIFAEQRH
jgi:c-di-GMP-binding flagellar brake protein YcgR